jgi:hypothetical protein
VKFEIESKYDIGDILIAKEFLHGGSMYPIETSHGKTEVLSVTINHSNQFRYLCELSNGERRYFGESQLSREESNV